MRRLRKLRKSRSSRDDANRTMQRDPLVTRNDKATAERLDSVEKQIRYINGIDSLMPIRNWKHIKETLLWKFGADDDPDKIRLQKESDRCHEYLMNWKAERQRGSRLCSGDSGDITFTDESTSHNVIVHETGVVRNCSLSHLIQPALDSETVHERDMVIQSVPVAEVSVQSETILKKHVFAETGHEDELTQEERLVAEMSLKGPDLVKRMALTTLDSVFKASGAETEEAVVMVTEDTFFPLEQNMILLQEHKFVQQICSSPAVLVVSDSMAFLGGTVIIDAENVEVACVHQLCDLKFLPSQTEQKTCVKTWMFKFKPLNLLRVLLQLDSNYVTEETERSKLLAVTTRHDFKDLIQLFLCDLIYKVKHKWRVKNLELVSASEFLVAVAICSQVTDKADVGAEHTWGFNWNLFMEERLWQNLERQSMHCWKVCVFVWIRRLRVGSGNVLLDSLFFPCLELYHTCLRVKGIRLMLQLQMRHMLQALQDLLVGVRELQVKHKWRGCADLGVFNS
ncbi:hypothetical protein Bca4012_030683 [Brassica carinata]